MKKHYQAYLNLLLTCSFFFFTSTTYAATFVVDITTDVDNGLGYTLGNGTNSLRKCLRLANANLNTPTVDIINFSGLTGGGPYTIQIGAVLGNLPLISEPVRLDGFTAGGAVAPTPIVVLRGAGAGPSPINNVFNITAGGSNSIIRGFVIYKTLNDAIYNIGATNVTIEGCWVGILETGAAALINNRVLGHGLYFTGGANNCFIGTTTAKNVISSNAQHGIVCVGSSGINIKNNYVGTNTIGTAALGNGIHGINIDNCPNTIIGGALANEGNLISGNTQTGLIILNSSTNASVLGNTIGTNLAGGLAIPNGAHGINIDNSTGAIIGGSNPGEGNLISGNTLIGIVLSNVSTNTTIKGNKIGTNLAGNAALPNIVHGINIDNSAGTIIGGSIAGEGNLISGNTQTGIVLTNASSNAIIRGNKIGTNLLGTAAIGNGIHGISIYTNVLGTTIGGGLVGEKNLISGNGQNGIDNTDNSHNTIIQGNYIGTNDAGTAAIGNQTHGIFLSNSNGITIGGDTKLKRNVISGNGTAGGENGIGVVNSNNLIIQGNFIGISANGLVGIGNFDTGISLTNSTGNTIGGASYLQRNVCSRNGVYGFYFFNVDNSTITGNYIGTDSTGNAALGNLTHGIHTDGGCNLNTWTSNVVSGNSQLGMDLLFVTNNTFYNNYIGLGIDGITDLGNGTIGFRLGITSSFNTIGGPGAAQHNYMSGNGDHGILIDGQSVNNTFKGNFSGSDITGLIPVPNNGIGILILDESNSNTIGGTAANEGNLFCCSATGTGVQIQISSSNVLLGNLIGVNKTGAIAAGFGNNGDGIFMMSYSNLGQTNNNNVIGGLAAGAANIIANNGRDGVRLAGFNVTSFTNRNPIIGNKIYCNQAFGIHMDADRINENEGVPAPAVTASNANTISGTGVNGNTIHVYRNQFTDGARCDCEGEIYVGTTVVAGGTWSLTHSLGLSTAEALSVTATQTNPTNSTSEFWVCAVPLPMDLLSLEAKKNNSGTVNVNFTVTNEKNINSYYILRSADGINFEMIGTVIPVNEFGTITSYSFEDNNPIAGTNYYRIQTVENDGRVSHSKIIVVNTSTTKTYLYPNPAGEAVTVVASGLITKVELLNALGQQVFEKTVSAAELVIPLSNFSTGVYYVKVYEGEFVGVYKLEHGL